MSSSPVEEQVQSIEPVGNDLVSAILDSINDGVITMDKSWRIIAFNKSAERITGVSREEAIGRKCCDILKANVCASQCSFRETMETGRPTITKAVYVVNAAGERIPISISTALLRNHQGEVIGGVETIRDLTLVDALRKKLTGHYTFADIISKNHRIQQLFTILPEIAVSDSTVLIEGESGTGKELFAKALHDLSSRRTKPFIIVNCGAIPDTLLESELFGYKAGAFTDAKKDKPGRFAMAEGGTIFLDEIGDVSPMLQVRLLRVLQQKTFEPLGGTETRQANVRVIAATNKNLAQQVREGKFRDDLFYRINVIRLLLPPLRERKEDIPLLVEHFITRFNRIRGKDLSGISTDALAVLANYEYPGNVRELENIIEHAFVLCPDGMIEPRHLPDHLTQGLAVSPARPVASGETLEEAEKRMLLEALERNKWNRLAAAKDLGIHKSTLFRKVKALGIDLPAEDGRSRQ